METTNEMRADALTTSQIAKRCKVSRQQVCTWIRRGIRCGGEIVRLYPDQVIGTRWRVYPETLEAFHAACRRAKLGDESPVPMASPSKDRKRGLAAKARVAAMLG